MEVAILSLIPSGRMGQPQNRFDFIRMTGKHVLHVLFEFFTIGSAKPDFLPSQQSGIVGTARNVVYLVDS